MYKVEVKKSSIVIHNYEIGSCKALEKTLTVYQELPSGYKIPRFEVFRYDGENNQLVIPRGFSFFNIKRLLKVSDRDFIFNDVPDQSKSFYSIECTTAPRDKLQEEAIEFLLKETDGKEILYDSQKMLCLKTGKGKTFAMIYAICKMKRKAIIIVDSLSIAEQWKNSFLTFTTIRESQISLISGRSTINKIMELNDIENKYQVYISTHQTLTSLIRTDPNLITVFFNKIKVGVKVYDEAHASWSSMFNIDELTNTDRTFYLTASPGRSDVDENKLYKYVFETVPMFGRDDNDIMLSNNNRYQSEKVDKNERYHIGYFINYNSHPSQNDIMKLIRNGNLDLNYYSDYTLNKSYKLFLYTLVEILNLFINSDKFHRKIAVLVKKTNMITQLYKDLQVIYPDMTIGRFCGLVPAKNKFNELNNDIILTTEKSCSKAVDIDNLGALVNAVPFSSPIVTEQVIGRLRHNAKRSFYVDIADYGFKKIETNQYFRSKNLNNILIKSIKFDMRPSNEDIDNFLKKFGID